MNRDGLSADENISACTPLIRHLRASTLTHNVRLSAKLRLSRLALVFPLFSLRRFYRAFSVSVSICRIWILRDVRFRATCMPVASLWCHINHGSLLIRNHTPPQSREKTNIIGFPLNHTKYYRPSSSPEGSAVFFFSTASTKQR